MGWRREGRGWWRKEKGRMRQSQVKEVWDGGGRGRVGRGKKKEE